MGFKINEKNYHIYKQVFAIIWRNTLKSISPTLENVSLPFFPTEVLEQWEAKSKKLAIQGLKSGLSDVLTNIKDLKKSALEDIENELKDQGLPNLKKLIALVRGHVQKAIKRGKIKNQNEYYIFKEFFDDTVSDLTDDERFKLSELMSAYEKSLVQLHGKGRPIT